VFAEEVRENGGAVKVRYIHNKVERPYPWVCWECWGRLTRLWGWESLGGQIALMLLVVLYNVSLRLSVKRDD